MELNYNDLKSKYLSFLENENLNEIDIAIHCNTKSKAEALINVYALLGKKWKATAPLLIAEENNRAVTRWNNNGADTCYRIKEDEPSRVSTSRLQFYEQKGVKVVSFEEVFGNLFDDETQNEELMRNQKQKNKQGFLQGIFKNKKQDNMPNEKTVNEATSDDIVKSNDSEATNNVKISNDEITETSDETNNNSDVLGDVSNVSNIPKDNEINDKNELNTVNNIDEIQISSVNTGNAAEKENSREDNSPVDEKVNLTSTPEKTFVKPEKVNVIKEENNIEEKTKQKDNNQRNAQPVAQNKKIILPIEKMKPFTVDSDLFSGKTFRFNQCGIREELKEKKFWVPCDCEWELSYIIFNYKKIIYLSN